jgi:S1-C subfamily serine protease
MALTTPPRTGSALVTFLVTALLLVTALAVLLRVRPQLFGLHAAGTGFRTNGELRPHDFPPRPAEPAGPLARYEPRPISEEIGASADEEELIALFRDATPSVCLVSNFLRAEAHSSLRTATEYVQGTGSGIVWDTEGHIVTNYHVVEGANAATVTMPDGAVHEAWLVGFDAAYDLAVMRIDRPATELVPIRFGRSLDLVVGRRVHSIGFPYTLGHTLSSGIVSGLERVIRTRDGRVLEGVIQTDADLHPGSSGGPLLDRSGRLVGLSLAVHGEVPYGGGLAFALPVDLVQQVVPRIMSVGFEWFPRFGFVLASDSQSAEMLALLREVGGARAAEWLPAVPERGVLVAIVQDDSPATRAGLRGMLQGRRADGSEEVTVRDIVVGIGGVPVTSRDDLDRVLHGAEKGSEFELLVVGAAGQRTVQVVAD